MFKLNKEDKERLNQGDSVVWEEGSVKYTWFMVYTDGIKRILNYLASKKGLDVGLIRLEFAHKESVIMNMEFVDPNLNEYKDRKATFDLVNNEYNGRYAWEEPEIWEELLNLVGAIYKVQGDVNDLRVTINPCEKHSMIEFYKLPGGYIWGEVR